MADDDRRTSKRSRFDQTEPEPKRASRFDRRSRSPTSRQPETRRSRSPLASNKTLNSSAEGLKSPADPAAAAGMSFDTVDHPRIMLTLSQPPQQLVSMPKSKQRKAFSMSKFRRFVQYNHHSSLT